MYKEETEENILKLSPIKLKRNKNPDNYDNCVPLENNMDGIFYIFNKYRQ